MDVPGFVTQCLNVILGVVRAVRLLETIQLLGRKQWDTGKKEREAE